MNVNPASEASNLHMFFYQSFLGNPNRKIHNVHVCCVGKACKRREQGGGDVKCSKKELRAVRGGDGQDVGGGV